MSKFAQYKIDTATTPTTAYLDTELYTYVKAIAAAKNVTITSIMAEVLTSYVNANGYPSYVYPVKESAAQELARLRRENAELKKEAEAKKKA